MLENEKYFVKPNTLQKNLSLMAAQVVLISYLLVFVIDYSDINWVLFVSVILLIFFGIFEIFLLREIKNKRLYMYYQGNTIYMYTGFNKVKEIDMSYGYIAKSSKDKINYILIKNESNKGEFLIGGNYRWLFSDIIEVLESKKNSNL